MLRIAKKSTPPRKIELSTINLTLSKHIEFFALSDDSLCTSRTFFAPSVGGAE